MKRFFYLLPIMAILIGFTSCSDKDDEEVIRHTVKVSVTLPSDVNSLSDVQAMAVTVFNTATAEESVAQIDLATGTASLSLVPGTYNFTASGKTDDLSFI